MNWTWTEHWVSIFLNLSPIRKNHLPQPPDRYFREFIFRWRKGIHHFYVNKLYFCRHLWFFMQIWPSLLPFYFTISKYATFPYTAQSFSLDDLLSSPFNLKSLISQWSYNCFEKYNTEASEQTGKLTWGTWSSNSTSCAKLNTIQFKIQHSIHYSKVKVSKIYPNTSNLYLIAMTMDLRQ